MSPRGEFWKARDKEIWGGAPARGFCRAGIVAAARDLTEWVNPLSGRMLFEVRPLRSSARSGN
jgi:hypothetical protein